MSYHVGSFKEKFKTRKDLQQYLILLAWIVIMTGFAISLHFFGLSNIDVSKVLIVFNLILWIGSHLFEYKDGKTIFQTLYYLSLGFLFITIYKFVGRAGIGKLLSGFWAFDMAINGFLLFVVGMKTEIEKYLRYKFGILLIGSVILIIINQVQDFYLALFISSLLLSGIYFAIHKILSQRPPSVEQEKTISVRLILAGERITKHQKPFKKDFIRELYEYLVNIPTIAKYALEGLNIILIVLLVIVYIRNIGISMDTVHEWLYRIMIANFVFNVMLLKRIGYTSIIQRLIVFAVINFAIYVSLFSICDGNIAQIAWAALLWNIFCAILIFYAPKSFVGQYFQKIDYIFWLITTLLAMIINIILFNRTDMPGQLLFGIIFLYIGIQGMTLFYATKHIAKMED
ncbi:hypothetical protein K9M48_04615 [Candidatus Gracilibacteria bacterium]|nr:hypothetical protein [Candidatus Gracilibacteria bacterium]